MLRQRFRKAPQSLLMFDLLIARGQRRPRFLQRIGNALGWQRCRHSVQELQPLDIALHLLSVDAPDQRFIDYGVVIVAPVRWRFPPFDAVLRVLLAEYEGHRVSPSLLGSSSLRRISASRSGTPSAMISAYIRRNSRPIAAMVSGGSAGSDLLSL